MRPITVGQDPRGSLSITFRSLMLVAAGVLLATPTLTLRAADEITESEIATLINVRRRDAEIIGIDPAPRDVTPTLDEYLRENYSKTKSGK